MFWASVPLSSAVFIGNPAPLGKRRVPWWVLGLDAPLPLAVGFVWRQDLFISLWLAQGGLELVLILLLSPVAGVSYRCVSPCLIYVVLGMENRTCAQ